MSAYVVSDDTINKVVSFLYLKASGRSLYSYGTRHLDDIVENGITTKEGQKELAEKMFALNVNAVNQRYGEGEAEQFRPLDFEYRFTSTVNHFIALKALRTWLYQCCEGDVPETSELYKVMDKVSGSMALAIVSQMPQYEAAPWG